MIEKIYIASRWQSQGRLRQLVAEHGGIQFASTASWIHAERPEEPTAEFFKEHGLFRAAIDINDIRRADVVVLDLTDGRGRRGGMMFEAGYAHGLGKQVFVIGDPDCVFTQLFKSYPTWPDFLRTMKTWYGGSL